MFQADLAIDALVLMLSIILMALKIVTDGCSCLLHVRGDNEGVHLPNMREIQLLDKAKERLWIMKDLRPAAAKICSNPFRQ